jgi:hypothetical protein
MLRNVSLGDLITVCTSESLLTQAKMSTMSLGNIISWTHVIHESLLAKSSLCVHDCITCKILIIAVSYLFLI